MSRGTTKDQETKRKENNMDELSTILEAVLPAIEARMNAAPSTFKLWFGEIKLISLTETTASFETTSNLKKKILTCQYREIMRAALEDTLGFPVEVEIFSPEDLNPAREQPKPEPKKSETDEEAQRRAIEQGYEEEKKMADIINEPSDKHSVLDEYTFDNFVEGSSNKFARAACYAVANEPCTTYNPLFIYGHSGLGKTHLLYAIINHMRKKHPDLKIIYKKCETFLDELIRAINQGQTAKFKEKYRSCDVLLIDDVQFLADKVGTQEEFFHTFSALYEADKQIILTSDRPPREIKALADRLRSRFESGLIADVQPPDFELRIAIIRKKADDLSLNISDDMVKYMAERLHNNIRQIEGVLKRLYAIYSFSSAEVSKEKIEEAITIIDPDNIPTDAMVERILNTVSKSYSVPVDQLKSNKRTNNIANARHIAIYLLKQLTELSHQDIGDIFGRNHSTVSSSIENVRLNMKTVNNYESQIEKLIEQIKENRF